MGVSHARGRMQANMSAIATRVICLLLLVGTICNSWVLLPPSVLLLLFSMRAYQWYTDIIISSWLYLFPCLIELVAGVNIRITGDLNCISDDHPTIVIVNHVSQLDWFYLMSYLMRRGSLRLHRVVTLMANKHRLGVGWLMQMGWCIFVTRNWSVDKKEFENKLHYYMGSSQQTQLCMYPEGTILSEENRRKDKAYAEKNGLNLYNYLLHPRTAGFSYCVQQMRKFGKPIAVCNLSVGIQGKIMRFIQEAITNGNWPSEVHFHVEHISPNQFTPNSEHEAAEWLKSCWDKKDKLLHDFAESGRFPGPKLENVWQVKFRMVISLLFWLGTMCVVVCALIFVPYFWLYCVAITVLFVFVSPCFGGWDKIVLWING